MLSSQQMATSDAIIIDTHNDLLSLLLKVIDRIQDKVVIW